MLSFVLNNPPPIKQPTYANKRIVYLTHTQTFWKKRTGSVYLLVLVWGLVPAMVGKFAFCTFASDMPFLLMDSLLASLKARLHLNLLPRNGCMSTGSCTDSTRSPDSVGDVSYTHLPSAVTSCYTKPGKRCWCTVLMTGGRPASSLASHRILTPRPQLQNFPISSKASEGDFFTAISCHFPTLPCNHSSCSHRYNFAILSMLHSWSLSH